MSRGLLIVVSGPSGVGKGTIMRQIEAENDTMFYSVSATTREPRENEVDGIHYLFISHKDFEDRIAQGRMLEYAEYCGNYYGTPGDIVEQKRQAGIDVLLEIESCGAMQIMEKFPEAVSVFIMPPSMEELRKRLIGRGTEEMDVIEARLKKAEQEVGRAKLYRHIVVNDDLERAKREVCEIINQYKQK